MRRTETWVQEYGGQIQPGPDGQPENAKDFMSPIGLQDWFGDVVRTTTREVRGARLTQRWRLQRGHR